MELSLDDDVRLYNANDTSGVQAIPLLPKQLKMEKKNLYLFLSLPFYK